MNMQDLDYSKIIDPKDLTVDRVWRACRRALVPVHAGKSQVNDMQSAFYIGFSECFKIVTDYAAGLPEEEVMKLYSRIADECMAWMEKSLKERGIRL